ncbi:thiamine phosphate synthase [Neisseria dentiae]|uniref:thiamine phosphate synthase n=1 Tax=Neisseria dentiae TaxID=194197 RepID=UPI0035A19A87
MFDHRAMLKLYFIAGTQDCRHLSGRPEQNLLHILEQALQSGITCFQFREKGQGALQDAVQIRQTAADCRDLCRHYRVPFFINDDIRLALELGADGVHIGQQDTSPEQAAALCKGRLMLGLSHNTLAELAASRQNEAMDYAAVGPIFSTRSKADAEPVVGTDFIRRIRSSGFLRPLVAIGGITENNAAAVRAAGADGVAVISAITQAADIGAAVGKLLAESA